MTAGDKVQWFGEVAPCETGTGCPFVVGFSGEGRIPGDRGPESGFVVSLVGGDSTGAAVISGALVSGDDDGTASREGDHGRKEDRISRKTVRISE